MEVRLSYAVVLDDEGRFAKVPNLGYSVGDTLEDVCLFDEVDGDPAEILEIDGDRAPERRRAGAASSRGSPRQPALRSSRWAA